MEGILAQAPRFSGIWIGKVCTSPGPAGASGRDGAQMARALPGPGLFALDCGGASCHASRALDSVSHSWAHALACRG